MIVMLTQSVLRSFGSRLIPEGSTQVALPGPYLSGDRVNTEESK